MKSDLEKVGDVGVMGFLPKVDSILKEKSKVMFGKYTVFFTLEFLR